MKNILILLSVITLFASCGKDGATGPAGPQGNANVTGTNYVVTSGWTYTILNLPSLSYYSIGISDNSITSDIVTYGSVSTFISFDNTNWQSLNWNDLQTTSYSVSYEMTYSIGGVTAFIIPGDGNPNNSLIANPIYYKVVAIAGSIKKKHPSTNWNNYMEVMKVINQENK